MSEIQSVMGNNITTVYPRNLTSIKKIIKTLNLFKVS